MTRRKIASLGAAVKRPGSFEFSAAHVSAESIGRDLDPVIGIDHFIIRAPTFAPHPHAGFSAVTYLFEDSEGEFINRDSQGHHHVAHPGAIIWTVTGSGVVHEEYPRQIGKRSHGLQMFVNLPAAEKRLEPRVMFVDGPEVPIFEGPGVRVRVMVGVVGDVRGLIEPPADFTFLDVRLEPGSLFEQLIPADQSVLAYVIDGTLLVGDEARPLRELEGASFDSNGDSVLLRASSGGAHVVLIAGSPLRERIVSYGPFVMNSQEQIAATIEHYRTGQMGSLAPAGTTEGM